MGEVMKKLRESEDRVEALRNDALAEKALMERDHQEALKAKDDIIASGMKDLQDAREEIQELSVKLKSLEELHQTDLETTANMTVELKELREFQEQTQGGRQGCEGGFASFGYLQEL
ncbi:hypothetical protein CsatB_008341 [Cannabis sativa]